MICSNCNKEIADGSTYCLECGAPIDEPVVLKTVKTKVETSGSKKKSMEYHGPLFDFSGYVKSLGSNTSILLGLVGAILVYLSPFLTWLWKRLGDNKDTGNLFEIGGKNSEMGLSSNILILMAVLIILSALDMLAFSGCRHIGPLKMFEKNYIVRFIPVILTIIFLVVILKNENYQMALDGIETQKKIAENFDAGSNFDGGKGIGPIFLIVGQVVYSASIIIDYLQRDK